MTTKRGKLGWMNQEIGLYVCTDIYALLIPGAQLVKNLPATQETGVTIACRRKQQPLQYSCLDKSHGQRSWVGYSPWDHKESDMTEHKVLSIDGM